MKSTLNSLMITAAGFALSAAAAYGQAQVAANIPFDFSASNQVYAAGEYLVAPLSHDGFVMKLQNRRTGRSAVTGIGVPVGNPQDKTAKLVFRCGSESGCALVSVNMGNGRSWKYNAPKLKPAEAERIAVVRLESTLAE
jgi:hypothetical protein